ncbi:hypothetical protein DEFDS_P221 (plasmid) [Deferribacter desulfuricans SSM1]|uniref:Uncharacterized protein n=1 Tax=Deferribacter desulfuricans (strain DSM 14783 / JCM 11476 / NBRC 101012 / SSM1) TaxID=639282 RepID=D3PF49_DEFDS|nr:hypothetical protein [Deferribacter desulfuricans]BAI81841.1 hypothetical protein DEFDS_P221 [Deferribacter desulfuricans SSM1]
MFVKRLLMVILILFLFFSLPISKQEQYLNTAYTFVRNAVVFVSKAVINFFKSHKEDIKRNKIILQKNIEKDIETLNKSIPQGSVDKALDSYVNTLVNTVNDFSKKDGKH